MPGTFRQLEVFIAVCRDGGFAAAADGLGISQVAVSRHVAALEEARGEILFDRRSGGKARLNPNGELLFEQALDLLERGRRIGYKPRQRTVRTAKVRIGADSVLLNTILRPNVPEFQSIHRDIELQFEEIEPAGTMSATMLSKRLDLAYTTFLAALAVPGEGQCLASFDGCLFVSPKLLQSLSWHPASSEPLPIVMPLLNSPLERSMHDVFARSGVTNYRVVAHVQAANCIELAINGVGACFLNNVRASAAVKAGLLVEVAGFVGRHALGRYLFRKWPNSDASDVVEAHFSALVRATSHEAPIY